MKELIITILKIATPLCVAFVVFAQGLQISPSQVMVYLKERPGLILRSLVAVLILVPLAALGIILLLNPAREIMVALAILVSCPPAPMMLKATPKVGKGNAAYMASLHLSLAVLALITVPTLLYLLSIPLGFHAEVNLLTMTWILLRTILIPICLGLLGRSFFPAFADKFGPVFDKAGGLGLLVVIVLASVKLFPLMLQMKPWSYLVVVLVSVTALAIGHWFGSRDPSDRTTLAVESGVRHPALALAIGVMNFGAEKALPVLIPCVLVFILVAVVYLVARKKSAAATDAGSLLSQKSVAR
jgi:BASS family bile acid:Na+ symporter